MIPSLLVSSSPVHFSPCLLLTYRATSLSTASADSALLPARSEFHTCRSAISASGAERWTCTSPTGLLGSPPPGPAMPVTETAISAPKSRRAP